MSIARVALREVAPAKPLKIRPAGDDLVWHLNLDQVEANSGRVLEENLAPASEAGNSTHWFDENHVLYSKLRPYLNKVVVPEKKGVATTELVPLRPDPKRLDRRYLAYYLRSDQFVNWVNVQVAGAKMPRVSMKVFWEHEIPLPPLPEQRRIAAILDKADAIRRKRQQAIRLTEEFLRSVFLDMFGDPVLNPKGWEVDELGYSLLDARNGMSRRGKPGENMGEIVLRLQDVRAGQIRLVEPNRIPLESVEKGRYLLKPGDITFVRVNGNKNYVGRSAVFIGSDEPIYYNDHIIRLRCNGTYNSGFLNRVFNSDLGKLLISKQIKTSAGQYTISQGGIAKMMMVKPPRKLQDKFSEIEKQATESLESFLSSNNEMENLFNSLVQRAFRGEL